MEQVLERTNEELIREYKRTNEKSLKQEITLRYIYLIKIIVKQMKNVYISFTDADDMINESIIALMDAIDTFDLEKNVKFETYLSLRIRGTIIDVARKQDWMPRSVRKSIKQIDGTIGMLYNKLQRYPTDEEICDYLGLPLDKYLKILSDGNFCNVLSLNSIITEALPEKNLVIVGQNTQIETPEFSLQKKELKQLLIKAIDDLKENEKLVISLYYNEEISIKEIAKILKLSESRISQIHSKSLLKLKHSLTNYVKI